MLIIMSICNILQSFEQVSAKEIFEIRTFLSNWLAADWNAELNVKKKKKKMKKKK